MSTRLRRGKAKHESPDHPVVPGSILYRVLQQVARAVAQRLAAQPDPSEHDNDQTIREREATGQDPDRGSPLDAG